MDSLLFETYPSGLLSLYGVMLNTWPRPGDFAKPHLPYDKMGIRFAWDNPLRKWESILPFFSTGRRCFESAPIGGRSFLSPGDRNPA